MSQRESESTLDFRINRLMAVNDETVDLRPRDIERRRKPRLKEPFPARIWGVDSGDLPFNVNCVVDNISSTGLYLRVPNLVDAGSEVRLIVHFLNNSSTGATAALRGSILRSELQADGRRGIAINITRHRFL